MDQGNYQAELSERVQQLKHDYKVLWTYYHVGQSLLRTLLKVRRMEDLGLERTFDHIIELEQAVTTTNEPLTLVRPLQELEQRLERAHYVLTQFDNNISPSVTRRYIERLHDFDPRLLVYLIHFILSKYPLQQEDWDKIDLLLTKLFIVDIAPGVYALRPDQDIIKIQRIVAAHHKLPFAPNDVVRTILADMNALVADIRRATSYADLLEWGLLARLREFKKSLQHNMLHPSIIVRFMHMNLLTKKKFAALYQAETTRVQSAIDSLADDSDAIELTPVTQLTPETAPPLASPEADNGENYAEILNHLAARMDHLATVVQTLIQDEQTDLPPAPDPDILKMAEKGRRGTLNLPSDFEPEWQNLKRTLGEGKPDTSLTELSDHPSLRRFGVEAFEIIAYQVIKGTEKVSDEEKVYARILAISLVSRARIMNVVQSMLARRTKDIHGWALAVSPEEIAAARSLLAWAVRLEQTLRALARSVNPNGSSLQRFLVRSAKKLQRTRVGFSLLLDQVTESRRQQLASSSPAGAGSTANTHD